MLVVKKYSSNGQQEIYSTTGVNYVEKFEERFVVLADGTELVISDCNIFIENMAGKTVQVYRA